MPVHGRCSFLVLRVSPLGLAVSDLLLPELWREVPALLFLVTLVPFATVQPSSPHPWHSKLRKKSTHTKRTDAVLICYSWISHLPTPAHIQTELWGSVLSRGAERAELCSSQGWWGKLQHCCASDCSKGFPLEISQGEAQRPQSAHQSQLHPASLPARCSSHSCTLSQKVPALTWVEESSSLSHTPRASLGSESSWGDTWKAFWDWKGILSLVFRVGKSASLCTAQQKSQLSWLSIGHGAVQGALPILPSWTHPPMLLLLLSYLWKSPPGKGRMCCAPDSANLPPFMHPSGHPWGVSACKSLLKHEHFPIHI